MTILDDAIREHLELKRAHGADEAELKKLEDEAFGPPGRPDENDSFSEGPTEFLAAPATGAADAAADAQAEPSGRQAPNITDLQEAPEAPNEEPDSEAAPAEEKSPSDEHQTVPVPRPEGGPDAKEADEDDAPKDAPSDQAPPTATGPSIEERHAIASQPTEFFDVEAEIGAGSEKESPSDEQLLDSKVSEPRLAPTEPAAPAEPADAIESTGPDAEVAGDPLAEDEDDFFSEQRLSDELNQALEAPVTDEHEALPELPSEEQEPYPTTDEQEVSEHQTALETDEHEAAPSTDEHEAEPPSEEHTEVYDFQSERREEHATDEEDERQARDSEDVLEDTPDFLEDAPEDDELWFEQKPPKDFDFDD